jgi:hypothetical protein
MKRLVTTSMMIAAMAVLAAVRVVHGSPDAPPVDVLVDGQVVLSNVGYPDDSSYLAVPAGARNLKVRVAGGPDVVIDATPTLEANHDYTVIASGFAASIQAWVLVDDNTPPMSGNTKVRLVHNAPSAGSVDIYVTAPGADLATATPVLTAVPFAAASPYLEVGAGTYQVRICPAATKIVAIDSGSLTLASGQIRTAIALDAPGGGSPFSAVVLSDLN